MKRLILNLAAGVSLLLCVAICVIWVRSYSTNGAVSKMDEINIKLTDPRYWIMFYPGKAVLCRQVGNDWPNPLKEFHLLGIDFGGVWGQGSLLWNLSIPFWMLATLTLILPTIRANIWRRHRRGIRRQRRGLCPKCGYDLRTSPDRCPECGAPAAARQS